MRTHYKIRQMRTHYKFCLIQAIIKSARVEGITTNNIQSSKQKKMKPQHQSFARYKFKRNHEKYRKLGATHSRNKNCFSSKIYCIEIVVKNAKKNFQSGEGNC